MSDPFNGTGMPRGALAGAAALILISITAAGYGRLSGHGISAPPAATRVLTRNLHFNDRADGAVVVTSDESTRTTVIEPGTNGFLRGVMRGLAQERKRRDIDGGPPFRLTRWSDGRLSIEDSATGRSIYLTAFGPTNQAAFAAVLDDQTKY